LPSNVKRRRTVDDSGRAAGYSGACGRRAHLSQLKSGRLQRAERLAALGRHEEAAQLFREAAAQDPHDADPLCGLAASLMQLGQGAAALEAALSAAATDPGSEWPHRLRSHIHLRQGATRDALASAETAVQLAPDGFLTHLCLFDAQLAARRSDDASATTERLRRLEPDHHLTHRSFGRLALVRRRAKEAEAHFREALRVRSDDATTLSLMGRAIELQHQPKRAIGIHQLAVQSDPRSQVARQALLRATRNHLGLTLAVITAGLCATLAVAAQHAAQSSRGDFQLTVAESLLILVVLGGVGIALGLVLWRRLPPQVRSFYRAEARAARLRSRGPTYLAAAMVLVLLLTFEVLLLLLALHVGLTPVLLTGFAGLLALSSLAAARRRLR
jgi:tetratricopeptide (TPR) repeat protein